MPNPPELVWLDNLTPKSTRFDDTYYSRHNGLEETRYVFIDGNCLAARWRTNEGLVIGELGFGTGLNFLATWQAWETSKCTSHAAHEDNIPVLQCSPITAQVSGEDNLGGPTPKPTLTYISFEMYPMTKGDLQTAVSPWPELEPYCIRLLSEWNPKKTGWQTICFDTVTLHLFIGDAAAGLPTTPLPIDAWYLDGFNPKTNPELWSLDLMKLVFTSSNTQATLASYTAAGWVRRNLQAAGFTIAKRKGFGHKRDMITGTTPHPNSPTK